MPTSNPKKTAFVPSSLYSLRGPIKFEQVIPLEKHKRLSNKPKKHQVVSEFHQRVTDGCQYLLNSGIQQDHIESWIFEPWEYNSIVRARDWWDLELMPIIRQLITVLNTRSTKGWKTLQALNPNHPDFKVIRQKQRDVKEKWFRRPRFKDERGRVLDQGY